MRRITTFLLVALATVSVAADEASEPTRNVPSVRSPVVSEPHVRRRAVLQNTLAASRALVIDLGPLPVEEKDTDAEIPQRTRKRLRRIGIHRSLPSEFTGNLTPDLDWTANTDGQHTAALTFRAKGAISLRIAVQAALPSGASVQVFDGDGQPRGSAFTQADFFKSSGGSVPVWLPRADFKAGGNALWRPRADFKASRHAPVWLSSAEGDTLTVQIMLPSAEAVEALTFTATNVAHRFASINAKDDYPELCSAHEDLSCVQADESPAQLVNLIADAVGQMTFEDGGSSYVCTGTLLNATGTPDVYEPYFLTANHCVGTNTVASTVEVAWFWRSIICNQSEFTPDPRLAFSLRGTDLLATSRGQDSTLLRFKESLPGGLVYAGWTIEKVLGRNDLESPERNRHAVFSVHHPKGFAAQYAEGTVTGTLATVAVDGNDVLNALETDWHLGATEGGSSGAGLFLERGTERGALVGVLSGGKNNCSVQGDIFGPFRDFFPQIRQWLDAESYEPEPETFTHMLPAVLGSGGSIQSFIRIHNGSERAGEVEIHAIDDTGQRYGPVTLAIDARQTRHFNSDDLERGAASKGLVGGVGDGTGMWRLDLQTTLTIEARAYIRTPDGFVTSMHQVAEVFEGEDGNLPLHWVPFFNPGSNTATRSLLRVINPNPIDVYVTVFGLDDDYNLSGPVDFFLAPNSAMQISSQALERGDAAFAGSLGDGTGKWALVVIGNGWPIHVMSLLSTPSGHLTNLSR